MKTNYKAGDIVRVQGRSKPGSYFHGFKYGQLVVVASDQQGGLVDVHGVYTTGPCPNSSRIQQTVAASALKPAKQAMRWRGAYTNRRG